MLNNVFKITVESDLKKRNTVFDLVSDCIVQYQSSDLPSNYSHDFVRKCKRNDYMRGLFQA